MVDEVLVPAEDVVEIRRGQKINAERKFFPGYVLVKMEMTDQTWHLIKDTPKVTGFLGTKTRPSPISDAEADRILKQSAEGVERARPAILFEVGEQIRVAAGIEGGDQLEDRSPRLAVAAHDRPLHRCRTPPPGQQGEVQVDPAVVGG